MANILIIVIGCLAFYFWLSYKNLKSKQQHIIEINSERQKENLNIETSIEKNKKELISIQEQIHQQSKVVETLNQTADKLREEAEKQANECAESTFAAKMETLERNFEDKKIQLQSSLDSINKKIEKEDQKLKSLQDRQLAYIQAQQRQKEIEEKQDYYRLVIDETDLNDIRLLRQLQTSFNRKDSIDKLIWENYYKPAYDALAARVLGGSNDKICGIYKITNQVTGEPYLGQSVETRIRWRDHIKAGLAHGKATNKLYQAMQKYGPENFTFELLEKVSRDKLNEREMYWINFYKSKEFGLNSQKGNFEGT